MVRHGYITEQEKEVAESMKVKDLLVSTKTTNNSIYQGYIDLVVNEIVNKTGMDPYVVPMQIYTNMDTKKQEQLNKVFSGKSYRWINKTIQGGAVAVDSNTGKIIAVVRTNDTLSSFPVELEMNGTSQGTIYLYCL